METVAFQSQVALAPFTTLRVGGRAAEFTTARSPHELLLAVREAGAQGVPLFVLGGGSNVLVGDGGFDGRVVHTSGGSVRAMGEEQGGCVRLCVEAGCPWDDVVAFAVGAGLSGIEALSGIPGQIGSAVMQNLGAYGQEVGNVVESVLLLDREDGSTRCWDAREMGFGYRTSMLRRSLEEGLAGGGWYPTPRWVVLEAVLRLRRSPTSEVAHPQLAQALGCETGRAMPVVDVRDAVLRVRGAKGMVADDPNGAAPDYDRWSSGSFFMNPVLDEETARAVLPADAPRYAGSEPGTVKTSAAWLIEHAGFPKGYGVHGEGSKTTLSTRHTLALTNRGEATANDLLELAREVRRGVRERFGVELEPESVLVNARL